jgi:hypothetical protein
MGNRRMAKRMAKRAGLTEDGVAVSFGFSSLVAAIVVGVLAELPYVGLGLTMVTFSMHRIVLVTDQHIYVFQDRPFHRPGAILGQYAVSPDSLTRRHGQLTFSDGQKVWHSPLFAGRARRIENAVANSPSVVSAAVGVA